MARMRSLKPEYYDDEGLSLWRPEFEELAEAGLVLPYQAGRPRRRFAYFLGAEVGGGSLFPPPSIQAGATLVAYRLRDRDVCHLCGGLVDSTAWRTPGLWPSLDHLTPRFYGGTDYPSNIRISHASCNKARCHRPISAFTGSPISRLLAAN